MTNFRNGLLRMSLCCAFAVGVVLGCEKKETNAPDDDKKNNLCADYSTCDECIAGQQTKGVEQGEAETQCGAAVLGCWTTWKKPIVCGKKTHNEKPAS